MKLLELVCDISSISEGGVGDAGATKSRVGLKGADADGACEIQIEAHTFDPAKSIARLLAFHAPKIRTVRVTIELVDTSDDVTVRTKVEA